MNKYKNLRKLKQFNAICLIGHLSPDADDFASLVAFKHFIKDKFKTKTVDIFVEYNKISPALNSIVETEEINPTAKIYDCAIMMDCPNTDRLGIYKQLFICTPYKIVIDHHTTNDFSGDINIVNEVSSTCEIVYDIMQQFKYKPSKNLLEKIYAGILTDTNGFAVGNICESTFKIAATISKQIDIVECYKKFLVNKSLVNMQMLAIAILNIEQFENGEIFFTKILDKDMKKFHATDDDLYGISNQLNSIYTPKIICTYSNKNGANYVSFRTKNGYDISNLAKYYGGGGHSGAAAFLTKKSYEDIKTELLPKLKNILKHKKI